MSVVDPDDLFEPNKGTEADEIALELARLLVETGAIKFGRFPLKNGRASPYILEVSHLSQGCHGFDLGRPYAKTIDRLFGPTATIFYAASQRALPFAVLAAWYYASLSNPSVAWACQAPATGPVNVATPATFGAQPNSNSNVVIIDDVLSAGVSVREAISRLKILGANVLGVCALVDRRDKSKQGRWTADEIRHDTGVKVVACAWMRDIIKHIPDGALTPERRATILGVEVPATEPATPRDSTSRD